MSQEFTDYVKSSFGPKATPKARRILTSLIQHIHDFTRENHITVDEWMFGVDFINRIGQMSDARRNEGILVSDVVGLEALVDTLTHASDSVGHTSSAIIGPFYRDNSPEYPYGGSIIQKEVGGEKTWVSGIVTDTNGKPLAGAKIEVWHCAPNGLYEQQDPDQPDYNLRGTFYADEQGKYAFIGLRPTAYPIPYDGPAGDLLQMMDRHPMRPGHIHWRVSHPEFHTLITQIYDRDCKYTKDDSVFAVKDDIIVDFKKVASDDKELGDKGVQNRLDYDIVLTLEEEIQKTRASVVAKHKSIEEELEAHHKAIADKIAKLKA
ncbi:hydroxyquinol 1,2 dioxygenase [Spathaspora passalidarum NRRL Y-27907]|uniref:Hydroxyquinol 1,2 dioxygenase n=1 Tax=Spathaspora passalidarum (strain NRRL Y-27907 / 11-Y1) TaxID=619300 RepID=G3AGQ9_SPAPN|nr:hydroxyquinol 1,2 dioxygenase [Spathaspora passalidarum NRRL Y-27907]EGW35392.1 hydroxyquinol 1,2 dioxygenase [Spathaspora passalidarum NRRL Y-27907]